MLFDAGGSEFDDPRLGVIDPHDDVKVMAHGPILFIDIGGRDGRVAGLGPDAATRTLLQWSRIGAGE